MNSASDDPEGTCQALLEFEREVGSLESYEGAMERCAAQLRRVKERREKVREGVWCVYVRVCGLSNNTIFSSLFTTYYPPPFLTLPTSSLLFLHSLHLPPSHHQRQLRRKLSSKGKRSNARDQRKWRERIMEENGSRMTRAEMGGEGREVEEGVEAEERKGEEAEERQGEEAEERKGE